MKSQKSQNSLRALVECTDTIRLFVEGQISAAPEVGVQDTGKPGGGWVSGIGSRASGRWASAVGKAAGALGGIKQKLQHAKYAVTPIGAKKFSLRPLSASDFKTYTPVILTAMAQPIAEHAEENDLVSNLPFGVELKDKETKDALARTLNTILRPNSDAISARIAKLVTDDYENIKTNLENVIGGLGESTDCPSEDFRHLVEQLFKRTKIGFFEPAPLLKTVMAATVTDSKGRSWPLDEFIASIVAARVMDPKNLTWTPPKGIDKKAIQAKLFSTLKRSILEGKLVNTLVTTIISDYVVPALTRGRGAISDAMQRLGRKGVGPEGVLLDIAPDGKSGDLWSASAATRKHITQNGSVIKIFSANGDGFNMSLVGVKTKDGWEQDAYLMVLLPDNWADNDSLNWIKAAAIQWIYDNKTHATLHAADLAGTVVLVKELDIPKKQADFISGKHKEVIVEPDEAPAAAKKPYAEKKPAEARPAAAAPAGAKLKAKGTAEKTAESDLPKTQAGGDVISRLNDATMGADIPRIVDAALKRLVGAKFEGDERDNLIKLVKESAIFAIEKRLFAPGGDDEGKYTDERLHKLIGFFASAYLKLMQDEGLDLKADQPSRHWKGVVGKFTKMIESALVKKFGTQNWSKKQEPAEARTGTKKPAEAPAEAAEAPSKGPIA